MHRKAQAKPNYTSISMGMAEANFAFLPVLPGHPCLPFDSSGGRAGGIGRCTRYQLAFLLSILV